MPSIPILLNHDHNSIIGVWENGVGRFTPEQRITLDELFSIFGGAGIRVLERFEENGASYVLVFEVLEFSLCPVHARATG